jgi:hypothetical protein
VLAFHEYGSFALDVCRGCGFTEWSADLRGVKAGRDDVVLLEGGEPDPSTSPSRGRNPYR